MTTIRNKNEERFAQTRRSRLAYGPDLRTSSWSFSMRTSIGRLSILGLTTLTALMLAACGNSSSRGGGGGEETNDAVEETGQDTAVEGETDVEGDADANPEDDIRTDSDEDSDIPSEDARTGEDTADAPGDLTPDTVILIPDPWTIRVEPDRTTAVPEQEIALGAELHHG